MIRELNVLQAGYDETDAMRAIVNTDHKARVADARSVYYPYKLMEYNVSVGRGRRRQDMRALCIIDMVTGRPAEGSGHPVFCAEEAEEEQILEKKIKESRTEQIGRDFVFKVYLNLVKMMYTPRLEIRDERLFYKRYYIVRCLDHEDLSYYVMVDAIDGSMVILDN